MSNEKRKQRSLDSYIIKSKRKATESFAVEQLDTELSAHVDHEESRSDCATFPSPSDNFEALDAEEFDLDHQNETTNVTDSHPDTHDNDIGYQMSTKTPLTDDIKHRLFTNPFRPDRKYQFPDQRGKDGTIRRFMLNWLDENQFLSYSPYVEGAFCNACCLFPSVNSKTKAGLFAQYPCSQFRHLKHFSTLVKAHLNSDNHRLATSKASNFIHTFENPSSSIDYRIDRQRNEMIERHKSILLSIIKVIITCARQNIALRGHRGAFSLDPPGTRPWNWCLFQMKTLHRSEAISIVLIRHRVLILFHCWSNVLTPAMKTFIRISRRDLETQHTQVRECRMKSSISFMSMFSFPFSRASAQQLCIHWSSIAPPMHPTLNS